MFDYVWHVDLQGDEELVLEAGGSVEAPCEGRDAVGEEVFDSVLGGEDVEEALFVGVEFFLGFALDDVARGGQAVLDGVLGGFGFAFGGSGAG